MFKTILILSILYSLTSCVFEHEETIKKDRKTYSKNFDREFNVVGRSIEHKIKPSELMQIGLPTQKTSHYTNSDFRSRNSNYNYPDYRNFRIRDQRFDRYNNPYRKSDAIISIDENKSFDDLYEIAEPNYSERNDNGNNVFESEIYPGHFKVGQPYQLFGVAYSPQDYESFEEIGIASWYGSDFHGKKTSNGEIYNMGDLTAAHPTLPLPSLIRVTNLRNGKSEILRVNDRGPFAKNRIIDVSERAAELLGFKENGTTEVKIELLRDETDEMLERFKLK